jgi:hypothetical protein
MLITSAHKYNQLKLMHMVQNKYYVKLIMYNQSNYNNLSKMYNQAYSFFNEDVLF